ncbi:GAF domain-containing sensor histidine kinase [Chthonobacter albigriseus]|uniref:GAF domain-containing sensor histidine kinase n=1 Tax=Chthonobacter albigriseus TaxID=1683161 RepID=UPI0015EF31B4|nr:GAF domain-containing sensor histidine kinase [Chthonobacter albigriseus]
MAENANPDDDTMLQHLVRISQALAGQLDFQAAIHAVAREVREILRYDHLDICLLSRNGETLLAYETGLHTSWGSLDEHMTYRSPIRTVLWGEVPYIVTPDATVDDRFLFEGAMNHPIFDARLRSRLHVPLRVQGAVIGALSCSTHEADVYTMEDVRAGQHVADLLAPYCFALRKAEQAKASAIVEAEARAREEGLRLGALRLTEELEHERQRIGMDLHDQVLADLTRLLHGVSRLREEPALTGAQLDPIAADLRASMQEIRRIIDDARPNVLQLFGFEHAVEDLLDRAARSGSFVTRLENTAGQALDEAPDPLKVALFRIVQEALNNAANHASASEIVVRLAEQEGRIVISITDDGVGYAARAPRRLGGIANMRTRAQLVGADFAIGAPPDGHGTQVTIAIHIPARLEAAQ